MRYYSITFDSYSGIMQNKHATSKNGEETVDVDQNGKLLIKETEASQYFEKYNVNRIEYVGTTAE